jgi:hypothetical protein
MSLSPAFSTAPDPVVYVVATPEGAAVALRAAASLRAARDTSLVLLVPEIADARESVDARARRRWAQLTVYERQAAQVDPPIEVRLCVGVSMEDAIERAAPRRATVVVAGRPRFWWPSAAQRLVEQLRRLGYDSVFVPMSQPRRLVRLTGATLTIPRTSGPVAPTSSSPPP